MSGDETALALPIDQDTLIGVLHRPSGRPSRGVLIVVGGPQYRVGSHRQFVLLARALAAKGFPVLRFDYRGMGDASGEAKSFLEIDEDIRVAADAMFAQFPSLRELVIWGLCDAASAALFYAPNDGRVAGLVLLNPWVRTEGGYAYTLMRHYYLRRIFSGSFWRKLLAGRISLRSFHDLAGHLGNALRRDGAITEPPSGQEKVKDDAGANNSPIAFPSRMLEGLQNFRGQVLLVLSGNDLTADEFRDLMRSSRKWRRALRGRSVTRRDLCEANHTFARKAWRDEVASWTLEWLRSW